MSEELTPQQFEFLRLYNDPKEETFGNAYQSAIKAGYTTEYAKTIISRGSEWLSENIRRRERILNKAEKRGEELLDARDDRVKADMVKHFTKTLGKEYYSEKSEIDHKVNPITVINYLQPQPNGRDNNKANTEATPSLPSTERPDNQ